MIDYTDVRQAKYYRYYFNKNTQPKRFSNFDLYLGISPANRNYVPRIGDSLDDLLQPPSTGGDISETILQDKQKVLGATVQHLKDQIALRTQIFQEHVDLIDNKIAQCESYLLNFHGVWPYTNREVEKIRANLGNLIAGLESEKRQETIKWWGDQEPLYTELFKTAGEFMGAKRRYGFLTGDLP